ncbi:MULTISPECIES: TonB family protein [Gammaproteobacteria]|uniref:TonB family protein n=1 Tax=Gammaproteobacteria TaxID=1236 RepID=UPI000DD0C387|nr:MULTISPECIES: TonB family protein [Gammaproteobacteria]RTE86595.1 TonB family protein [Aliidiomarina sp. B3213]TCZ90850.1 TonB family protein [Lysobacter sp. N42]
MESLINFGVASTLFVSAVSLLLLITNSWSLKHLGARATYQLWVLIPLSLVVLGLAPSVAELAAHISGAEMEPIKVIAELQTAIQASRPVGAENLNYTAMLIVWGVGVLMIAALGVYDLIKLHYFMKRNAKCSGRFQYQYKGVAPSTFGLFKPNLLLPDNFASIYNSQERRFILTHEIMHWRRGDTRANLVAWLLFSVQWFNPLMWAAYRRFRVDQELACDADVLAKYNAEPSSVTTKKYAQTLLKATAEHSSSKSNAWSKNSVFSVSPCSTHYGNPKGNKTMLKQRFNQLQNRSKGNQVVVVVSAAMIAACALAWNIPTASAESEEAPTPLVRVSPMYPAAAARNGVEGHVRVRFTINQNGQTENLTVIESVPEGVFEREAMRALSKWRYMPQDNVEATVKLEFNMGSNN